MRRMTELKGPMTSQYRLNRRRLSSSVRATRVSIVTIDESFP